MDILNIARDIARHAHAGQRDLAGAPYIGHVMRVAASMRNDDIDGQVVALLHDVLEDSPVSAGDLAAEGIPERLVASVVAISKRPGERYEKYLARVKADPVARRVKFADLRDNSRLERLVTPGPADYRRVARYMGAVAFLMEP